MTLTENKTQTSKHDTHRKQNKTTTHNKKTTTLDKQTMTFTENRDTGQASNKSQKPTTEGSRQPITPAPSANGNVTVNID